MKKTTLVLVSMFMAMSINAQVTTYNVGDVVNDFTVTDTDGVEHNLYSITAQGKYVYLDFFFDSCVPCQQNQPTFNEFYDKYGCNEGLVYCLSINNGTDNDAEVIAYKEAFGGPWAHPPAASADGGSAAVDTDFGVSAYPTFCLINPNNEIIVLDIWPLSGVQTFEATFPDGFEPPINYCTLGTDDIEAAENFKVYPNPSDGTTINLSILSAFDTAEISIYNILGALMYSNSFDQQNITISTSLKSGTYFVTVKTNETNSVQQLVVK